MFTMFLFVLLADYIQPRPSHPLKWAIHNCQEQHLLFLLTFVALTLLFFSIAVLLLFFDPINCGRAFPWLALLLSPGDGLAEAAAAFQWSRQKPSVPSWYLPLQSLSLHSVLCLLHRMFWWDRSVLLQPSFWHTSNYPVTAFQCSWHKPSESPKSYDLQFHAYTQPSFWHVRVECFFKVLDVLRMSSHAFILAFP